MSSAVITEGVLTWLRTLAPPATWNDFVDLLSKTVVAAAAGAIAAGLWFYEESRKDRAEIETSLREADEIARKRSSEARDTIALFNTYTPLDGDPRFDEKNRLLANYCLDVQTFSAVAKTPPVRIEWFPWLRSAARHADDQSTTRTNASASAGVEESGSKVVRSLCEENKVRASAQAGRTVRQVGPIIKASIINGDPGAYAVSEPGRAQQSALVAAEASEPSTATKDWFAVIASVPISQAPSVPKLAGAFSVKLSQAGFPPYVNAYCTRLSGSIALTSGARKTQVVAEGRAGALRRTGLVLDAFAQPDRGWVWVDVRKAATCPELIRKR